VRRAVGARVTEYERRETPSGGASGVPPTPDVRFGLGTRTPGRRGAPSTRAMLLAV